MKIDAQLLQQLQNRIAQGDQRSFEDLYRLFFARLFNFALLLLRRREIAEETVNDVMMNVWNRKNELTQIQNLETYLFVAVRNRSLNHLARFSQMHVVLEPESNYAEIIHLNDPEKQLEWKEIHFRLNQAIDQLPGQCRTVFRLIKEEGFRYKQVAEILNISPRTVETQLFRAIKKLNKVVSVYLEGKDHPKRDNTSLPFMVAAISMLFM